MHPAQSLFGPVRDAVGQNRVMTSAFGRPNAEIAAARVDHIPRARFDITATRPTQARSDDRFWNGQFIKALKEVIVSHTRNEVKHDERVGIFFLVRDLPDELPEDIVDRGIRQT